MIGVGSSQAGANDIRCECVYVASIGGEEDGGRQLCGYFDLGGEKRSCRLKIYFLLILYCLRYCKICSGN